MIKTRMFSTGFSDPMHDPDSATTVSQLRDIVRQFVNEREWQSFHNPKNLVMSLAIETAELMEHFQWLTPDQSLRYCDDPEKRHQVEEELADCLAYVLAMANQLDIDVSQALRHKMTRNAIKYPVAESRSATSQDVSNKN